MVFFKNIMFLYCCLWITTGPIIYAYYSVLGAKTSRCSPFPAPVTSTRFMYINYYAHANLDKLHSLNNIIKNNKSICLVQDLYVTNNFFKL